MIPVNESKTYCTYCRGEILADDNGQIADQEHQYHQECFNEIIKDNHCEYCSKLLNELNTLFVEQQVKIHKDCITKLENQLTETLSKNISNYLKDYPIKKLAKDAAFYEMKQAHFTTYLEDMQDSINKQIPDFSDKSESFQKYASDFTTETTEKIISEYINKNLQVKFNAELEKCRNNSKKEIIDKILHFMWITYLEIPISYKNGAHHKVMPAPVLDNVNYIIFHFKLESLFKTKLDFNTVINSNFIALSDFLLGEPISFQHLIL